MKSLLLLLCLLIPAFGQQPNNNAKPSSTSASVSGAKLDNPTTAPDPLLLTDAESKEIDELIRDANWLERERQRAERIKADKTVSDDARIMADVCLGLLKPQQDAIAPRSQKWVGAVKQRAKCEDCEIDLNARKLVKPAKPTEKKP